MQNIAEKFSHVTDASRMHEYYRRQMDAKNGPVKQKKVSEAAAAVVKLKHSLTPPRFPMDLRDSASKNVSSISVEKTVTLADLRFLNGRGRDTTKDTRIEAPYIVK